MKGPPDIAHVGDAVEGDRGRRGQGERVGLDLTGLGDRAVDRRVQGQRLRAVHDGHDAEGERGGRVGFIVVAIDEQDVVAGVGDDERALVREAGVEYRVSVGVQQLPEGDSDVAESAVTDGIEEHLLSGGERNLVEPAGGSGLVGAVDDGVEGDRFGRGEIEHPEEISTRVGAAGDVHLVVAGRCEEEILSDGPVEAIASVGHDSAARAEDQPLRAVLIGQHVKEEPCRLRDGEGEGVGQASRGERARVVRPEQQRSSAEAPGRVSGRIDHERIQVRARVRDVALDEEHVGSGVREGGLSDRRESLLEEKAVVGSDQPPIQRAAGDRIRESELVAGRRGELVEVRPLRKERPVGHR